MSYYQAPLTPIPTAAVHVQVGSLGKRIIAYIIDGVVLMAAMFAMGASPLESTWLWLALDAPYRVLLHSSKWQATIGKKVMDLRVVSTDGSDVGVQTAALRYLIEFLSGLVLCLGHFFAFFDDRRRTVHDRVADTLVIADHR